MKRINCGIVGIYEFQGDNKLGNAISIWFHSDKPWINKFFGAIATASHQSDPYALHIHIELAVERIWGGRKTDWLNT